MTLSEAEFLLTDLNFKLVHVFGSGNKRMSFLGQGAERGEYSLVFIVVGYPREESVIKIETSVITKLLDV